MLKPLKNIRNSTRSLQNEPKGLLQNQARGGAGGIQCYQNSYTIMNNPIPSTRARMMQATRAEILVHRKYYSWSVCPLYPPIHILHPVSPHLAWCNHPDKTIEQTVTNLVTHDTWNAVKPTTGQGTCGEIAEQKRAIKEPLVTSDVTSLGVVY